MKKISKRAHIPHVSGGNGYTHDNGNIAFGNPMDLIEKREFFKKYEQEYRELYPASTPPKCRKKMILKNENL